jgi:hypothetical protein
VQTLELFNPTKAYLKTILREELDSFLVDSYLSVLRTSAKDELIVFDNKLSSLICQIQNREIEHIVIRPYKANLAADIQDVLSVYQRAIFHPSPNSLRHFYNLNGFIDSMNSLANAIENTDILIPPGIYGTMYLFGLDSKRN